MSETALIAVDWGTTSLRLWRFAGDGRIRAQSRHDLGILKVEGGRFGEALAHVAGADAGSRVPVLMSGMIGSRQGWVEAPYVFCPAALDTLAGSLQAVPERAGAWIVPGVAVGETGGRRDVMRGEETQILGAGLEGARRLVVLPGTHCKWVVVEDGRILDFATFMTGEIYHALRHHTILGRLMQDAAGEGEAAGAGKRGFAAGLATGLGGEMGLLQACFNLRARGLFDELAPPMAGEQLSGLLIGSELAEGLALARRWGLADVAPLVIGGEGLAERYRTAFAQAGLSTTTANEDAGACGLWRIARHRGLVA